jgi:hypothetical protein
LAVEFSRIEGLRIVKIGGGTVKFVVGACGIGDAVGASE